MRLWNQEKELNISRTHFYWLNVTVPNPAKDKITILYPENFQIKEVCIFNQTGMKLVCEKGAEKVIDISEMQPGLYFIEIKTNKVDYREKLIIQ